MAKIPMATRQFYDTTRKESTLQVAADTGLQIMGQVKEMQDEQQAIKMDSMQSQAMYDMQKATQEWRLKNQSNPNSEEALAELNMSYDSILQANRDNLSPEFRNKWDIQSNKIKSQYGIQNMSWGFEQNQRNVKTDIDSAMASNINLARGYGQSGDVANVMVGLTESYNKLLDYGTKNLGSEEAAMLLSDYEDSYISEAVLGSAEKDPYQAMGYLDSKEVSSRLTGKTYRDLQNRIYGMQKAQDKRQYEGALSKFYSEPSEALYNEIKKMKPDMSDKKDEQLRSMVDFMPDYTAMTTEDGKEEASNMFLDMLDGVYDTNEQKLDTIVDMKRNYQRMNNQGALSSSDYEKYSRKIADVMQDDLLMENYQKVSGSASDLNLMVNSFKESAQEFINDPLSDTTGSITRAGYGASRSVASQYSKAVKIADDASNKWGALIDSGDVQGAKRVIDSAKRELIWLRNPEFNGAEIGDVRSVNGVVYRVDGYDKDVIVTRVVK